MDIRDSLAKLLNEQTIFTEHFYPRFFEICPEAKSFFVGVDMERQAVLLGMALISLTEGYLHSFPTTISYLKYLGRDHQQWGIPRELYAPFGVALLDTIKEQHDEAWDEDLEQQWREAIRKTTELLLDGYQDNESN